MAHMQPSWFMGETETNNVNSKKKNSFCLEHLVTNIMENNDILYALSETGSSGGMLIEKINNGVWMPYNEIYHCLIFE